MEYILPYILLVIGFVLLIKGADFFVDGASSIARKLKIPSLIICLTIVSIGTSLPEFVTSIVAARKKEVELSLGNAIGSNIFNLLLILGLAGTVSPLAFLTENIIDVCILLGFSAFIWIAAWAKKRLGRLEGVLMILFYVAFVVYIGIR